MTTLNRRGDVCGGIGGGVVSVNRQAVAQPAGTEQGWLDDDRIIYQICEQNACRIEAYNMRSGVKATVLNHGANHVRGNGGVWAVWYGTNDPATVGITTSTGLRLPSSGLGPLGPDGAMAVKVEYQSAGPWDVIERDGSRWRLTDGDAGNINLVGQRRAIWTDERGLLHAVGMPMPTVISHPFWWLRVLGVVDPAGVTAWWVLYQADDGRLVLHPFTSTVGYVVTEGQTYAPDLCLLPSGLVRVVWSISEGEPPADLATRDVDLRSARVELAATPPKPPDPPTPTQPPPKVTVRSYDTLMKAGVPWHLDFVNEGDGTSFLVQKDDADMMWIEARNSAGVYQTGARHVIVEGPAGVAAPSWYATGEAALAATTQAAAPVISVTLFDSLMKAGVPWHLDFTNEGDDTAYLVTKDEHDQLWIDARNGAGRDQTRAVRQLTVEGPDVTPPEPPDPPIFAGGIMLSSYADPAEGVLAVKSVKPVSGTSLATLIMPNDRVVSCQPDGTLEDRDPGTDGAWERCRAGANVATYSPEPGKYFSFPFVEVAGL